MTDKKKPQVDLAALAQEFSVKQAPESADERIAREKATKTEGKSTKRTNRIKALVMGNLGNSGGM